MARAVIVIVAAGVVDVGDSQETRGTIVIGDFVIGDVGYSQRWLGL